MGSLHDGRLDHDLAQDLDNLDLTCGEKMEAPPDPLVSAVRAAFVAREKGEREVSRAHRRIKKYRKECHRLRQRVRELEKRVVVADDVIHRFSIVEACLRDAYSRLGTYEDAQVRGERAPDDAQVYECAECPAPPRGDDGNGDDDEYVPPTVIMRSDSEQTPTPTPAQRKRHERAGVPETPVIARMLHFSDGGCDTSAEF